MAGEAGSIDNISIEIGASSTKAINQINRLKSTLSSLKDVMAGENGDTARKLGEIASALKGLSGLGNISIGDKLPDQLRNIASTVSEVSSETIKKLDEMTSAIERLKGIDLHGFSNAVKAAKKAAGDIGADSGIKNAIVPMNIIPGQEIADMSNRNFGNIKMPSVSGTQESSESVKTLGNILNRVSSAFQKFTNATRQASQALHSFGKSSKKSGSSLGTFFSALKRIAMYRLLRTIIKSITTAFSEGLKNAYAFSQGIASEGSRFAAAMDSMSSAGLKMKNQLGSAFIALLAAIAPIVNAIISLVTMLANALSQLFAVFTGGTYLKANDVSAQFADNMKKGAGGAKEWKNQLMGFDEINRLEDQNGGGGGGGTSAIDPSEMFTDTQIDGIFAKMKAKIDELKESLDFSKLKESWNTLKESVQGLADVIEKGLGWVWDNILVPLAHWTIEEAAPALINLLASAFDFLRSVLEKLSPVFQWLWDNILQPIAEWTGDMFIHALETMTELFQKLTDLLDGNTSFKDFINDLTPAESIFLSIATAITAVVTALTIYNAVASIAAVVTGLTVAPVLVVIGVLTALIAVVIAVAQHWDEIKAKFQEGAEELREDWERTKEAFSTAWENIKTTASEAWENIKTKLSEGAEELRTDLSQSWELTKEDITTAWENIKSTVSGIWDNIKTKATNTFESIRSSITEKINAAKNAVQTAVDRIKGFFDFQWAIPHIPLPHIIVDWEPTGDGAISRLLGISAIPHFSIQWFAKGGIIDGATLLGAGEAGQEAIIPLEHNTQWISKVASELATMTQPKEEDNDDIINAIFAASTQIVNAIAENSQPGEIDWRKVAKNVTAAQRQMARAY